MRFLFARSSLHFCFLSVVLTFSPTPHPRVALFSLWSPSPLSVSYTIFFSSFAFSSFHFSFFRFPFFLPPFLSFLLIYFFIMLFFFFSLSPLSLIYCSLSPSPQCTRSFFLSGPLNFPLFFSEVWKGPVGRQLPVAWEPAPGKGCLQGGLHRAAASEPRQPLGMRGGPGPSLGKEVRRGLPRP